jgi:type VI secretion system ImpA family protein
MIDAGALAVALEGESPAGISLEYDPLYLELDSLAVETPDSFMGESKIEGRGPDWKKLGKNCLELWAKTRDLRVAVYLVIAEAITGELAGLVSGLKLPVFLVRELWDSFYPRLDPDDDKDPLERLNILSMISPQSGAINDPVMFIPRVRETRLTPSLAYTLRDLLVSLNEIEGSAGRMVDPKLLRAELMTVAEAEIAAQAALVREGQGLIAELCGEMNARMQEPYTLDMSALSHELDRLAALYGSLSNSPLSPERAAEEGAEPGSPDAGRPAATWQSVAGRDAIPASGERIALLSYHAATRTEALVLLKKGAEYFQAQEPNSPIPY